MTRLPRELAPWTPFLEMFPDEAAHTIWPWLQRLHALVGDVHLTSERMSGEADGFDGLTRRGIYDRLVTSEWALLEFIPEEFIRRAAMNEQLFLQPVRKSPQEAKRSVMLFHAGPDQLGAPRLVHLALLITMARRAIASRTSFAWGILQNPPDLSEGFSAEHLRLLINARTWGAPESRHIGRWKDALVSIQPDDLWVVGSSGLTQLPRLLHSSMIVVDQPLEIPATYLSVSAARHGNAPHMKVRLEIPAQDAAVHLLRATEYRRTVTRPAATTLEAPGVSGEIQLSWDGRRLFTRGVNSRLVAYHIPNSSGEPPGKTQRLDPGPAESLLAATLDQKKWSWVTLKEGNIYVHGHRMKDMCDQAIEDRGPGIACDFVAAHPDNACVPHLIPGCHFYLHDDKYVRWGIAFTDGRQALVVICSNKIVLYKERASYCVDSDPIYGRSLLVLQNLPGGSRSLFHTVLGEICEHPFEMDGDGTFEMVNYYGGGSADRIFGINDVGRRWRFCARRGNRGSMQFDLEAPAGSKVIGWMPSGSLWQKEPCLLCWTKESGIVVSASEKRNVVLFNAFKPIRSCLYHPGRAIIAMSTEKELIVYSLQESRELIRIKGSRA